MVPQMDTFFNAYKVLALALLPSKTKETTFQTLSRMILMHDKAFISGKALDPTCLCCNEPETMEHPLFACANYSA
jgi:hypothetical protein